jgi:N-acetylglucosamine-6-phosphate deacetylase
MATLAPELDGGIDAVAQLAAAGAVAAIGHTDASYDVAHAAVDAGARVATHLFNAMRPIHHREPGVAVALMERPEVVVELINDGVHLHPSPVRWVMGRAQLVDGSSLAGSTLTMDVAFRRAVGCQGLPVVAAARAAATIPATLLGLDDVGLIAAGRLANLVVLKEDLSVQAVMHRGRWVDGQTP